MTTKVSAITSKKNIFFTFSIRKNIFPILFVCFIISLIIFSSNNLIAAKNGLKLWANNVVPALFPFFIATELLSYTNIIQELSNTFTKFMRPIFNVPGSGAYAFILGLISGYPVGAKIVTDLRNSNMCTKSEGQRMLAFTNNSGPLFIIGTIGITLFRNSTIGIVLLITHILSSITVGIIFGFVSKIHKDKELNYDEHISVNKKPNCTISNLGEILTNCIITSIHTILLIGGFIIIFSVIISILNSSKILTIISYLLYPICKMLNIDVSFIKPVLTGFIELTNGISLVCNTSSKYLTINIVLCAFLLGFGGICVLLQVLGITSKSDLSIKTYIYGKLLQGIIAAFYTYILISSFSFLNFNL